ncbi:hypothetical protein [Archaeoglobus veneficus]|uniref:Uncharacterized protein n=1 Tax=Archaeoglobus veneficus (strain DSM 11195 / SNP6) TaxID=693661 RepID=F2KNZ2_ARCVS|nr:hypothetical protein [Archaeoglobus veneficus]AEA46300.1 hypothetical protein Arcve_0264 [Archaeoglobus veneficus SNP6]
MKKAWIVGLFLIAILLVAGVAMASTMANSDNSVAEIQTLSGSMIYQNNEHRDEVIKKSLEIAGDGWKCIGMYTVDTNTMDMLVILKKDDKIKYVEVYKQEKGLVAREVIPRVIEKKVSKDVIYNKDKVSKEEPAKIFKEYGKVVAEVQLLAASPVVVEAWSSIEAKNALGITLWNLTAKGYFHVYPGDSVFYVADDSSAYANGYLGWYIEYFDSDATWTSTAGRVDARAGFDNSLPWVDGVDAWAWVQVDKYLQMTKDAGYT